MVGNSDQGYVLVKCLSQPPVLDFLLIMKSRAQTCILDDMKIPAHVQIVDKTATVVSMLGSCHIRGRKKIQNKCFYLI